jgi:hypothetical protein
VFGSAPAWLVGIEVLLFTLGAVAFGVVLWLGHSARWRHTVAGMTTHVGTAIAANSLVYCLCNILVGVYALTGRRTGLGILTLFTVTTYLFPPLIIADTLAGDPRRPTLAGGGWRFVHRAVWFIGAGLSLFVVGLHLGLWRMRVGSVFFNISIGSLFLVAIVVALIAARARRRMDGARAARPEARWVARLFVVSAGLSVALMVTADDIRSASYGLSLTTRLLPLAFLVAGAYADGRDLLVKRVTLALLAMASLALGIAVVRPVVAAVDPWRAAILSGVLLGPLVLVLVGPGRVLSDWLDTWWLGRRYSPGDAIEHLLSATRPSSDLATVQQRALSAFGEMFDADARLHEGPPPALVSMNVATAPVSDDLHLEVTRRDESRRFYSEDLALVRSVSRVLGLEFDRLALERERQAEAARALRAQVNPHFLFNALNAIGGWLQADPRQAEAIVEQLAGVFRYTLRGTTSEWVTLGAELDAVAGYLAVERARFGSRLSTQVDGETDVRAAAVPPLVLLTLVENAIKHGVAASLGDVRVSVQARRDGTDLVVDVVDTGDALDVGWATVAASDAGGFGLASVRERLRLVFGDRAALEGCRDAARHETRFTIRMPWVPMAGEVGDPRLGEARAT